MRSLALILALLIGGCGLLPELKDETAGWSANRLYSAAKEAMGDGSYDKAVKYFEILESRYPYGRYAQQAQIEIAYAYYKANEPASAIAACDRFIKLHPNHPNVDYVYYLKGLVNFNEDLGIVGYVSMQDQSERDPKAARESFDAFKEMVSRYPSSKYAADATARMKYLVNALASHEVHVARYYMKRGAWVAAAQRAKQTIEQYDGAPAVREALEIMVEAYDRLEMKELAEQARAVYAVNFPAEQSRVEEKKSWWRFW